MVWLPKPRQHPRRLIEGKDSPYARIPFPPQPSFGGRTEAALGPKEVTFCMTIDPVHYCANPVHGPPGTECRVQPVLYSRGQDLLSRFRAPFGYQVFTDIMLLFPTRRFGHIVSSPQIAQHIDPGNTAK